MERKKFLKITALGTAGAPMRAWMQTGDSDDDHSIYSSPQMVGDVSQTSAILQSRLTSQNEMPNETIDTAEALVEQDIPGSQGVARFEVADNRKFNKVKKTPWHRAKAEHDFIIKHKIKNLKSGVQYYMRVRFGPSRDQTSTGPVSQFSTLPSEESEDSLSFVVSSCMNLSFFLLGKERSGDWGKAAKGRERKLGYKTLEAIKNLEPSFWIQTGDNVYYDHPGEEKYRAKTQKVMRAKWHRQWAMPRAESLLRHVPAFWMVDDHDFRYNDSDERPNDKPPSTALGKKIFCEQLPITGEHKPKDDIYRTRRVGKHLQIWTMDGRFHRDDNNKPDRKGKSMWGKKQYKWLKETLLSSTATFKLLVVGTPLIGPDDEYKNDNHTNYSGFQHERDHFFGWLKNHGFLEKNFYILTGDRHWQYHSVHPTGFEEFGTGTITTQNARYGKEPGDSNSTDPMGLIKQPYIQEEPIGGFIRMVVESSTKDHPAQLTFETTDENGDILNSETKSAE